MKESRAFILISSLLFLSIFTLVVFFALEEATLLHKTNYLLKRQIQARQQLDKNISDIEWKIENHQINEKCFFNPQFLQFYAEKPKSWWQSFACPLNENAYFVIEPLAQIACLLALPDEITCQANFYRISILSQEKILQFTELVCQTKHACVPTIELKTGRQNLSLVTA